MIILLTLSLTNINRYTIEIYFLVIFDRPLDKLILKFAKKISILMETKPNVSRVFFL